MLLAILVLAPALAGGPNERAVVVPTPQAGIAVE